MRIRRTVGAFAVTVGMVSAAIFTTATPASAAIHQNGSIYAHWNFQGDNQFWNVDQQVIIRQKAANTFWAMNFKYGDDAVYGGYLGLQTNGQRWDNTSGDTIIFSMWGADAWRDANGTCRGYDPTGENGGGLSCRDSFTIKTGVTYRLRMWRLEADAGGQWWGAWIHSSYGNYDYHLGDLRVAASHQTLGRVENFVEYYGPAKSCDEVPVSRADFTQPAANRIGDGLYQFGSTYQGTDRLSCTGGGGTPFDWGWTKGVTVKLGGPR